MKNGPLGLWRSLKFLVVGPLVLGLLFVISLFTHGHGWLKWAALGIGIAWLINLSRVLRAMLLLGGLAAVLAYLDRRAAAVPRTSFSAGPRV